MTLEEIVGKVLNIDPSKINNDTSPENTEEWDSFNGLLLVSEIEKQFNFSFDIKEVLDIKNIGDIRSILKRKDKI